MRAIYYVGEQQLFEEDPYPFRRLYRVGQTLIHDSVTYCVERTRVEDDLYTVTLHHVSPGAAECPLHSTEAP